MRVRHLLILTAMMMTAACAAPAAPEDLFGEYIDSTTVRNDRITSTGSSADRLANFAAYYSPEQLQFALLAAVPCAPSSSSVGAVLRPPPCQLGAVQPALASFADPGTEILGRSVLVKRSDGTLELITLHVARGTDGRTRVIDTTGEVHDGLEDFQAANDLLGADDFMLVPQDLVSVPGEGAIVTVPGHTPDTWPWWLLGGVAGVGVIVAVGAVIRRSTGRRDEPA